MHPTLLMHFVCLSLWLKKHDVWLFVGCISPMPTHCPTLPAGKLPDMKSTWSPGTISNREATGSLSHELWKVPQGPRSSAPPPRPPPGLTNTKPSPSSSSSSSSPWGGNSLGLGQSWSSSYTSGNTTHHTLPQSPFWICFWLMKLVNHIHTIPVTSVFLIEGLVKKDIVILKYILEKWTQYLYILPLSSIVWWNVYILIQVVFSPSKIWIFVTIFTPLYFLII